MTYTAEITKGATAERYRAYAKGPMTRKPRREDLVAMAKSGKEFKKGQRVAYAVEHVVKEGTVDGAHVSVVSADDVITRVVFYGGPPDAEVVVGSVEIGEAGAIAIDLVEEPGDAPEPIPESELGA